MTPGLGITATDEQALRRWVVHTNQRPPFPVLVELRCGETRRGRECRNLVGAVCATNRGPLLAFRIGIREPLGAEVPDTVISSHLQHLDGDHLAVEVPAFCAPHHYEVVIDVDRVAAAVTARSRAAFGRPLPSKTVRVFKATDSSAVRVLRGTLPPT